MVGGKRNGLYDPLPVGKSEQKLLDFVTVGVRAFYSQKGGDSARVMAGQTVSMLWAGADAASVVVHIPGLLERPPWGSASSSPPGLGFFLLFCPCPLALKQILLFLKLKSLHFYFQWRTVLPDSHLWFCQFWCSEVIGKFISCFSFLRLQQLVISENSPTPLSYLL